MSNMQPTTPLPPTLRSSEEMLIVSSTEEAKHLRRELEWDDSPSTRIAGSPKRSKVGIALDLAEKRRNEAELAVQRSIEEAEAAGVKVDRPHSQYAGSRTQSATLES